MSTLGAIYLRDTARVLSAPGVPVRGEFATPGGKLVLLVESYNFDLRTGSLQLRNPSLVGPAGRIASAKSVQATGLYFKLTDETVRVRITGLVGRLQRLPSGRIDLEAYLPKTEGPPSKVPFEVLLRDTELSVEDRSTRSRLPLLVTARDIAVAGMGNDWTATSQVAIANIGSVKIQVQRLDGQGTALKANTGGLQLARVLAHISKNQQLNLSASRLSVTGTGSVWIPDLGSPSWTSRLSASADSANYGQDSISELRLAGVLNTEGWLGGLYASEAGTEIWLNGRARWDRPFEAEASYALTATNLSELPKRIRALIPADLRASGIRSHGVARYGPKQNWHARGDLVAGEIRYLGKTATALTANFDTNRSQLRVSSASAFLEGARAIGAGAIGLETKQISGIVQLQAINLDAFLDQSKDALLGGTGDLVATVMGSIAEPQGSFIAIGNPVLNLPNADRTLKTELRVVGTIDRSGADIEQGVLTSGGGTLVVTGEVPFRGGAETLRVQALDFPMSILDRQATGKLSLSGRVTGDLANPTLKARVEGVNVGYKGERVAALAGDLTVSRDRAELRDMRILRGTAVVSGGGSYRFEKGQIEAQLSATGIALSELTGGQAIGVVNVPRLSVGGSARLPLVNAEISGRRWVARGVPINSFGAKVRLVGDLLKVEGLNAEVADGKVAGQANLNVRAMAGHGSFSATNLQLGKLATDVQPYAILDGLGQVQGTFGYGDGGLAIKAKGGFDNIVANEVALGDAQMDVSLADQVVNADFSIGRVLPELRLLESKVRYDVQSGWLSGNLDALRVRGETIVAALGENLAQISPESRRLLESSTSEFTFGGLFGGTLDRLSVEIPNLKVANLSIEKTNVGEISATRLIQAGPVTKLTSLNLTGQSGRVDLAGFANTDGSISGRLTAKQFSPAALAPFVPSLASDTGKLDLDLGVSGPIGLPSFLTQAKYVREFTMTDAEGNARQAPFTLEIPRALYLFGGGLDLRGTASFDGFEGALRLKAKTPIDVPLAEATLDGTLELKRRALNAIPFLANGLDSSRTQGDLGGEVRVSGTFGDPKINGLLTLNATEIAPRIPAGGLINRLDTTLKNLAATIAVSPELPVTLSVQAESSSGGNLALNLQSKDVLNEILFGESGKTVKPLERGLQGTFTTEAFRVRQALSGGLFKGAADTSLEVGGTFQKPSIRGAVALSGVEVTPPTLPERTASNTPFPIDPTFDITLGLRDPAKLKSSVTALDVKGSGEVRGSLNSPKISASLIAQSGQIQLPGGLIRVEKGGTVDFLYSTAGRALYDSSLNVDLAGRTSVVTSRYGEGTRRYDVRMTVQGDFLNDAQLRLDAQTDPPDLNTNEVLALLGRTDLVTGLGSNSGTRTGAENQLRDALTGLALPSLLNPVTSGLAEGLRLDYLSLDYSALDQTTVSFAKALSREFSVQGRRQVGTPLLGQPLVYDLRLVYSPYRLGGAFRRLNFVVGADQERPFKLALEYSGRFGRSRSKLLGEPTVLFPAVTRTIPKHQK